MLQILVRLLSLSLVILFIITGSNLTAVVSRKGMNDSAELLQNNVARIEVVLVNNVHAAAGRESKLRISWKKVVDKINGAYGSLLTPIQRGSSTTIAKVESKAVVADTEGGRRVRRRSLFSKEKKNESGFVAYSADYGRAIHHPPKNN